MKDMWTHIKIDIEVYDKTKTDFAQGKYLVHGYEDVFWTDDIRDAILFFVEELRKAANEPAKDLEGFCANCGERCDYC